MPARADGRVSSPSPRGIGFWMTVALVMGNMIGSGIFLLPASLASYGAVGLAGWLISTAGALLLAAVFAHLSRLQAAAGGPYAYTRRAFGDLAGFLVAWGYWISMWTALGALAVAFVGYLGAVVPVLTRTPESGALVAIARRVGADWRQYGWRAIGGLGAGRDDRVEDRPAAGGRSGRAAALRCVTLRRHAIRAARDHRRHVRRGDADVVGVSGSGIGDRAGDEHRRSGSNDSAGDASRHAADRDRLHREHRRCDEPPRSRVARTIAGTVCRRRPRHLGRCRRNDRGFGCQHFCVRRAERLGAARRTAPARRRRRWFVPARLRAPLAPRDARARDADRRTYSRRDSSR